MFSPELETLDQLAGGDLSLAVVASFYPGHEAFKKGILGCWAKVMLSCWIQKAERSPSGVGESCFRRLA